MDLFHQQMKPEQPASSLPSLSFEESRAVNHLLSLYRQGWFPMNEEWEDLNGESETRWVQPSSRGVIPLDPVSFHIPGTLRAKVRSGPFEVTADTVFERVIHECGEPAPGRESTWLDNEIVDAFLLLHKAGHAHSIEAWTARDGTRTLVGGLYGLALGRVFCGESMFSRPALGGSDASKVCLVHLVHHLRRRGFVLLDSQLKNDHLAQFGCHDVPREEYLATLTKHAMDSVAWQPFEPSQTMAALLRSEPQP
jgi:leucyl/phenylalanyl-tRNA---protein transferase